MIQVCLTRHTTQLDIKHHISYYYLYDREPDVKLKPDRGPVKSFYVIHERWTQFYKKQPYQC